MSKITQKITPFLWFDSRAEEAANFYVSIFKNSKMGMVTRRGDTGPGPKGSVMTAGFTLDGKEVQCGWLQDRFGLSWQIVPTEFFELISNGTQEQSDRVMAAMMKMVKMDLAKLKEAYNAN